MSINLELKNKIRKHIRKYMTVVCSLLLLPLFSINSYAAYSTYPQYDCTHLRIYSYVSENGVTQYQTMQRGDDTNYYVTGGPDWNNRDVYITTFDMNSSETDDKFYFPVNTNLFDYYFVTTLSCDRIGTDFIIDDFDLGNITDYNTLAFSSSNLLTDKKIYKSVYDIGLSDLDGIQSYTCTAKLNLDYVGDFNIGVVKFFNVRGGFSASTRSVTISVIVANKGDTGAYNDIVNAINNQTSQLGGKLDGIDSGIDKGNDLIENGNSGTESTISDFNEVFDDFNTELDNIEKFDTEIIEEFESANETYLTELNNFSLSASLLNAGNWLSSSMQTVYDNSSDYKMLWLVPLLLGIPLLILFVRKGDNNE